MGLPACLGNHRGRMARQIGPLSMSRLERQTVPIMTACSLVGVSRRTIYNWIACNRIEYVRTAGGSIRIFVDTLWREPDGSKMRDANV